MNAASNPPLQRVSSTWKKSPESAKLQPDLRAKIAAQVRTAPGWAVLKAAAGHANREVRSVVANFRQNVARFRLYQHRFLQENTRLAAFFKIYKIIKLKFWKFGEILQILRHLQRYC